MTLHEFCGYIDHTLLKADATPEQVEKLCDEAREYPFASVCVNGSYVELAAQKLRGTRTLVAATIGFPLGMMTTEAKAFEAKDAVQKGAGELDMVINVGRLKAGDDAYVLDDIKAVVQAAGDVGVKVIIEACLLTDAEKVKACKLAQQAGAAFVKTSTGFSTGGATVEDVVLMRKTVGPDMGVKAAGGIRSAADMENMIAAGANRIGTSGGYQMAKEFK